MLMFEAQTYVKVENVKSCNPVACAGQSGGEGGAD